MDSLRLEYEIEQLEAVVAERRRIVDLLRLTPSRSDTVRLEERAGTCRTLLETLARDPHADKVHLRGAAEHYNELLATADLNDRTVDLETLDLLSPDTASIPDSKRVRFNSEPEFEPYHDDPSETRNASVKGNAPATSDRELFRDQQQQLQQQDTHLEALAQSVRTTHGISTSIQTEVEDQNEHLLYDMEAMIDSTTYNLERARRRLNVFTNAARENGPCTLIIFLITTLIVLVVIL